MASHTSSSEVTSRSEISSPAPSFPDSSSNIVTNHKLHGQNYLQWSQSVFMYICGRGKDGHLTGETAAPETADPNHRSWKTDDHLVMSWLINSMTTEVGENFLLHKTAKDIWEAACETYSSTENTSELFEVETRLYDLKQGEMSVTQYFNTLTRCWLQLDLYEVYSWKCTDDSAMYKKIIEKKRTIRFLLGLNKDLDEVRGRVMGIKPFPNLREAFSEVRREESRKKLMMTDTKPGMDGSALFTHNSSQSNRSGKGRPWCDHCKKPGHVKANCWKIHGKPTDWKPSHARIDRENRANAAVTTEKGAEGSPFTREQIEALQKMLSQANNPGQPSPAPPLAAEPHTSLLAHQGTFSYAHMVQNQSSKTWIIDSGASDHMTGDVSLLQNYQPCTSSSGVRIADGSLSPVVGIGSVQLANDLLLSSVLYVPRLNCNLISIS